MSDADRGRRTFLLQAAAVGVTGAAAFGSQGCRPGKSTKAGAAGACVLTVEQEEGPYYLDAPSVRTDITEGRAGVPLRLRLTVMDVRTCSPIPDAAVDIWHCDPVGEYSGFDAMMGPPPGPSGGPPGGVPPGASGGPPPGGARGLGPGGGGDGPPRSRRSNPKTFLRGVQLTRADGVAEFVTVYPGWYVGRAVHIHLKVHIGGSAGAPSGATSGATYVDGKAGHVCHTGQMFLPEPTTDAILAMAPYAGHPGQRLLQSQDGIYLAGPREASILQLTRLDEVVLGSGFLGELTLGVDPSATPAPSAHQGGPPAR